MITQAMSTRAILQEIGNRLQRERLNQNISQQALAAKSGVARRALQNVESDGRTTLETLVNLLRALDKVEQLDLILPDAGPSPIQLARLEGRRPQRASSPRPRRSKES